MQRSTFQKKPIIDPLRHIPSHMHTRRATSRSHYLKSPHKSPNTSSFFDAGAGADCPANSPSLLVCVALPPQMSVVLNVLNVLVVLGAGAPQMLAEGVVFGRAAVHPEETPH